MFVDHKLRDIFQGMDKFIPKINERIGFLVTLVENSEDKFNEIKSSRGYAELLEFFNFKGN